MTTADALHREPPPFEQAIFLDGLITIMGAGGGKAATGGEKRGNKLLVEANEKQNEVFHAVTERSKKQV